MLIVAENGRDHCPAKPAITTQPLVGEGWGAEVYTIKCEGPLPYILTVFWFPVVISAAIIIIDDNCSFDDNGSFYNNRSLIINWRRGINHRRRINNRRRIITIIAAPIPGVTADAVTSKAAKANANGKTGVMAVVITAIIPTMSAIIPTMPTMTTGQGLKTCHEKNSQCNYNCFHVFTCFLS